MRQIEPWMDLQVGGLSGAGLMNELDEFRCKVDPQCRAVLVHPSFYAPKPRAITLYLMTPDQMKSNYAEGGGDPPHLASQIFPTRFLGARGTQTISSGQCFTPCLPEVGPKLLLERARRIINIPSTGLLFVSQAPTDLESFVIFEILVKDGVPKLMSVDQTQRIDNYRWLVCCLFEPPIVV